MKKIIVILLFVTMAFTILASYNNQEAIIICSSAEQFRNDELQNQLNKKFPDKDIIVMYMPTGKAASKVLAEGTNTEIDILLGLETGYMNKISENLADISGLSTINYLDTITPEDNNNKWITWEKQAGAIIINRDVLNKYNLDIPTDYNDLLNPKYKNLIAMPDPKSSGTGYFFYKNWVNTMGTQNALDYVDKLYKNLKQFTESGSGPIKLLKQGEIGIGLTLTFQAVNEINDGQPLEIIYPESGSPYSLTGTAIIKNHLQKDGVAEVYDFLINEFLIYDKENFSPEIIYKNQINTIPNYPTNIVYADMQGIQDDKEKERLLSLWKY